MTHVEIEFFQAPFLASNTRISTEDEERRIKRYVKDLTQLIPRLQRLRTSTVTTQLHINSGVTLSFSLRERQQRDLFSPNNGARIGSTGDFFEQEVHEVQSEVERLMPLLEQAMSPGVTPVRLRSDDPIARQMRIARELMLKRRGVHVLSGIRKSIHFSSALFFPQGTLATISAQVSSMSPGHARLKEVTFSGEIPTALANVRFHRSVQILRPNLSLSEDVALRLYRKMESEMPVTMNVLIVWDIVTGQPYDMEFRQFIDASTSTQDSLILEQ